MITGLAYVFTSIALAILLPILLVGDGHDCVGDVNIYRYPKNLLKLFLFAVPLFACGTAFVYSTFPSGEPSGLGLVWFGVVALCVTALPAFAYLYFRSYRVLVESQTLQVISLFRTTVVDFRLVAKIATFQGKGQDLWLYDHEDNCLAKIGGSLQDFGSLLFEIERRTRFPNVTLYKGDTINGWQEGKNAEHICWYPSKGPTALQKLNKRVMFILAVGCASIAIAYWVTRVYPK